MNISLTGVSCNTCTFMYLMWPVSKPSTCKKPHPYMGYTQGWSNMVCLACDLLYTPENSGKEKNSTPEMMWTIKCHIILIILIDIMMREAYSEESTSERLLEFVEKSSKEVQNCHISRFADSSRWISNIIKKVHLHECVDGHIFHTTRVHFKVLLFYILHF